MKEILIVSNYYPPEKGAAANRIEQLALKLRSNGYKVWVVCPLPNYPKGKIFDDYRSKFSITEEIDGVKVSRLWIFPSNSKNFVKRVLSIISFSTMLLIFLLFKKLPKKAVVQSPPLLLSFISVFALKMRKRHVILNVSDLWPLAALELEAMKQDSAPHKVALALEKYIYRNSDSVLGQSEEILAHVQVVAPNRKSFLYRNYPDHKRAFNNTGKSAPKIKLFYAGLLGIAQGVLDMCRNIETQGLPLEIHIFGDGAEKNALIDYLAKHPEKNIRFHGMLNRDELIDSLKEFDVALVPLRRRIFGSVPSKIFEYAALGLPLLYFGGGEGEHIVKYAGLGWIASVGDYSALNDALEEIAQTEPSQLKLLKAHVYHYSAQNFNLNEQIKSLIEKEVF